MFNWDDSDILYKPELMVIVEYMAAGNCYRAKPFFTEKTADNYIYLQQIGGTAPFSNTRSAAKESNTVMLSEYIQDNIQNSYIYPPQTAVMALVPRFSKNNPTDMSMGFILGTISSPFFCNTDTPPVNKAKEISDINADKVYEKINDTNQTTPDFYVKDNLKRDVIPGDAVNKSLHAYQLMDNYSLRQGTDTTCVFHSYLTGELIDVSLLKQEYTSHSDKTEYVINGTILQLDQYAPNPFIAGLDCIESIDGEPYLRKSPEKPLYLYSEAKGDIIDGNYRTLYIAETQDDGSVKRIPVCQEFICNTGAYELTSKLSLKLGHVINNELTEIDCTGSHFKPKINGDVKYAKRTPIPAQDFKAETTSAFSVDKAKAAKESYIDFDEDGNIMLKDVWGSYIKLIKGNIQIHAVNNLFITTGRDTLVFSGGVESHKVSKDIQLESSEDIMVSARKTLKTNSASLGCISTNVAITGSQTICLKGADIQLHNDENTSTITVGNASTTILSAYANTIYTVGHSRNIMMTDTSCISLNPSMCYIHASTQLSGDLTIGAYKQDIEIGDNKYIMPQKYGSIFITQGSLYASDTVVGCSMMLSDVMMAKTMASTSGILGKVDKFSLSTFEKFLSRQKQRHSPGIKLPALKVLTEQVKALFSFRFNKSSKACTYIAEDYEKQGTTMSSTETDSYIYPGQSFWTQSGLCTITVNAKGEKELSNTEGFGNYRYNNNNVVYN